MSTRIALALTKLFERHRVVFWYDAKQELRADYEALGLDDVEKREIAGNELGLKYHVLREHPDRKFLLYHAGPRPADLDNWLLDVLLAQGEFRTDQVALWLSELGIGPEFSEVVEAHAEFFQAAKRRDALKRLIETGDTLNGIRLKMLAVCAGAEVQLDAILAQLLAELAQERDEKRKLIERCGLDAFLWEQLSRTFGYASDTPSLWDFTLTLFISCYATGVGGMAALSGDALAFLKRWKDSRQFGGSFERLSNACAEQLGIERDLEKRDFRDLLELDMFHLIDRKILSDLVRGLTSRTLPLNEVVTWTRQRRASHWHDAFQHVYEAIEHAARFLQALDEATLTMSGMADGVTRYAAHWFRIDQHYRKFVHQVNRAGQASLLGELAEQIENLYTNNFLLTLNDRWQPHVDRCETWDAYPVPSQRAFHARHVRPFLEKENKICVIVSDALRYEIADELLGRVRQEDRYEASLEPVLSVLPSYTQLGMAALLPHRELALVEQETGVVLADGQSTQGLANREKILQAATPQSKAIKAEDVMALNKDECRALVRDHNLLFVYHNVIDAIGDKRDTEDRAFEAAEDAQEELIRLIKKLSGANVTNLIVTADHGFLYQQRALEESDFSDVPVRGEAILFRNRRFVLGKGLEDSPSLRKFTSAQLGLAGEVEVQVPKSINRLRVQGAGSRFVHGGTSLQEVVVPVLSIRKKRQSDVSVVEVEILRGASSVITSGQLAVTLYQTQAATEKLQPRKLRAGIYTQAGELISDVHELLFDLASENTREREVQLRFVLTRKADEANGQEVVLRLEEKLAGTSHYREYKAQRYTVRRSFTTDFDF